MSRSKGKNLGMFAMQELCQDVQAGVEAKVLSSSLACLRGFLTAQAVQICFAGKHCTKSVFVKKDTFPRGTGLDVKDKKAGIKISQAAFIFLRGDFACWSGMGWEDC